MGDLAWSGCTNVRDVGGLPADGGAVRERVLVRADSLTRLDDHGIRALDEYGVARIIDLRTEDEARTPEHPYAGRDLYRSVPWIDVDREPGGEPSGGRDLAAVYRRSLDRNVRQVAAAVRAFLDAPSGAVVVHCAGGKDRTGMLVALLLESVGVSREAVVGDYAVSADRLGIAAILDTLDEETRARAEPLSWSHPETITVALEHLDTTYGGASAYLRDACGLSDAELLGVRRRLLG